MCFKIRKSRVNLDVGILVHTYKLLKMILKTNYLKDKRCRLYLGLSNQLV